MSTKHEDGRGGHITILEHGSATAPMRFHMILPKNGGPPAPECHPSQTEDFKVLRGTLDLGVIDGKRVLLKAGDTFHLPAGVYHQPNSAEDGDVEIEAVLTPGLESADMFTNLYAVLRERRGLARFAGLSLVLHRYTRSIRFKAPVRAVMAVVSVIARVSGVGRLPARVPSPAHSLHSEIARAGGRRDRSNSC